MLSLGSNVDGLCTVLVCHWSVSLIVTLILLPDLGRSVAFVMILLYDYVLTFGEEVSLSGLTRLTFRLIYPSNRSSLYGGRR
jgi:hypothetical protein